MDRSKRSRVRPDAPLKRNPPAPFAPRPSTFTQASVRYRSRCDIVVLLIRHSAAEAGQIKQILIGIAAKKE